ncbi:MAG: hypothetical protein JWN64_135 [Parcubacteria group bacterium]|nr:hypothetical protein [Parcubacteria group bacterium]
MLTRTALRNAKAQLRSYGETGEHYFGQERRSPDREDPIPPPVMAEKAFVVQVVETDQT